MFNVIPVMKMKISKKKAWTGRICQALVVNKLPVAGVLFYFGEP